MKVKHKIIALFFMIGGVVGILLHSDIASALQSAKFSIYVEEVMRKCESAEHRPTCYDRTIPNLLNKVSANTTLKVAQKIQQTDDTYQYCHVAGHRIGARLTAQDPSRWIDVVGKNPRTCANGVQHGAFQERFRGMEDPTEEEMQQIIPELKRACRSRDGFSPSDFEQANCYHGLGHLTLFLTNGDIPRALRICDVTSVTRDGTDMARLCYEGLFMQVFQPFEPEGEALVKGVAPTEPSGLDKFCTQFDSKTKRETCWIKGWALHPVEEQSVTDIKRYCNENVSQLDLCYNMLLTLKFQIEQFDQDTLSKLCKSAPADMRPRCYTRAARSFVEAQTDFISRSVQFCENASAESIRTSCFEGLVSHARYDLHNSPAEREYYCQKLPAQWQTACMSQ